MSWLSKAIDKVSDVVKDVVIEPIADVVLPSKKAQEKVSDNAIVDAVKDVARPIVATVDYGSSAAGAYGDKTQDISTTNLKVGAVGAALITAPALVKTGAALLLKPTVGPNGQVTGDSDLTDVSHNYTYGYDDGQRLVFDGNGNVIPSYKLKPVAAAQNEPGMELSSGLIALVIIIGVALAAAHIRR